MFTLPGNSKIFKEMPNVLCFSLSKLSCRKKKTKTKTLSAEKYSEDSKYIGDGQVLHFVGFTKLQFLTA